MKFVEAFLTLLRACVRTSDLLRSFAAQFQKVNEH